MQNKPMIKPNYPQLAFLIFALICATLACAMLYGCSAQHHLNKYQQKGGVCGKIDTIRTVRYDTLTNTFYKFDSLVIVNDRIVPQTRLETRIQYRMHKDTVRYNTEVIKYLYKERKLQKKENTQWSKTINWVVICACILLVLVIINRIFKI